MIQALRHERLPRTLHVDTPTTKVDWTEGDVRLLTEPVDWPRTERPRRTGVSAFGVSGTNAHVILEEAPAATEPDDDATADAPSSGATATARTVPVVPWILSARTTDSLRGQARALLDHCAAHPDTDDRAVAHTLATRRSRFEHRAVVLGADRDALLAGLRSLAAGETSPHTVTGAAHAVAARSRSCSRVRVRSVRGWGVSCTRRSRCSRRRSTRCARTWARS
ncbi:ketoacyl-synthetase C-terminal extension domain-containing protein [Streptomyces lusitanus]|uniref:ketoacyl-synthetase C-terminal extension domain-containing protein n=1 Tax=Streptomyces lusitanus TaxID=68232 RepID=UPI0036284D27